MDWSMVAAVKAQIADRYARPEVGKQYRRYAAVRLPDGTRRQQRELAATLLQEAMLSEAEIELERRLSPEQWAELGGLLGAGDDEQTEEDG